MCYKASYSNSQISHALIKRAKSAVACVLNNYFPLDCITVDRPNHIINMVVRSPTFNFLEHYY